MGTELTPRAPNEDELAVSNPVHAAVAPSSAPPVVRLRSASSHLPSKHELITGARKAELLVITATMAVIDVEDRVLLAIISSAAVAALACGVYI